MMNLTRTKASLTILISKFIICLVLFLFPRLVLAYDPDCAHPTLTQRAAEIYALHYGKELSTSEMENIKEGSRHEDISTNLYFRSTNHFYDIHNHRPWDDVGAATLAAGALSYCFIDSYYKGHIHTAKEWALTPNYQKLNWTTWDFIPCMYDGDYSWPTILEMLDTDAPAQKTAFALGHILHLIQDMTVPAHTRNDSHYPPLRNDYLEGFAKSQCNAGLIPSARQLYAEGVRPIVPSDIGKMFDELATYTYSHYLSKNTKFSPEYDLPSRAKVRRGEEIVGGKKHVFLYIKDPTSTIYGLPSEFRLIEVDTVLELFLAPENPAMYFFSDYCTDDYWQRTMRKAIAYSAGVIRKAVLEANDRQTCSNMSLLDPECAMSCNPGTKRCSGGTLYTCNASGTGETSVPCPSGTCQDSTSCSNGTGSGGGSCGTGCPPPLVCSSRGCVGQCGLTNRYCCEPGHTCNIPGEKSYCDSEFTCWPCGSTDQRCCPTGPPCYRATYGFNVYCNPYTTMCWPCGGRTYYCCPTTPNCEAGLSCQTSGPYAGRCF